MIVMPENKPNIQGKSTKLDQQIIFMIDRPQADLWKKAAALEDRSLGNLIRHAMRCYLMQAVEVYEDGYIGRFDGNQDLAEEIRSFYFERHMERAGNGKLPLVHNEAYLPEEVQELQREGEQA